MFATMWNLAHPLVKIYSIYLIFLLKIPSSGILKGPELHQEVFRCPGSAWHCGSCGQSVLCPQAAAPSCVGVFLLPGASEPKCNLRPVLSPFIYSSTLCRSQTFRDFLSVWLSWFVWVWFVFENTFSTFILRRMLSSPASVLSSSSSSSCISVTSKTDPFSYSDFSWRQ